MLFATVAVLLFVVGRRLLLFVLCIVCVACCLMVVIDVGRLVRIVFGGLFGVCCVLCDVRCVMIFCALFVVCSLLRVVYFMLFIVCG